MSRKKVSILSRISKKGIIEIQFNWIFVLIVGFLLLLFIVSIILTQRKQSEDLLNAQITRQLTASIKGKQQISNAFSEITIPKTNVYFTCDNSSLIFDYKLEGGQRQELANEIIFAPKTLYSNKLLLWTQDFNLPFIVTRFSYVTTNDYAYIIYTNGPPSNKASGQTLFDDLHSNLTKYIVTNGGDLQTKKNQNKRYRIICFTGFCPAQAQYEYIQIDITPPTDIYNRGTITFHKPGSDYTEPYIGKAALFGAIFSDDAEYYECQIRRALNQFDIKRQIYLNRLKFIEKDLQALPPSQKSNCLDLIVPPKITLDAMSYSNSNYAKTKLFDLASKSTQLQSSNQDMNFASCPYIY